jgi:predicted secreted protein
MRQLGLTFGSALSFAALVACKGAPEPAPAEASAPTTTSPAPAPEGAAPPASSLPPAPGAPDAPAAGAPHVYGEGAKSVTVKRGERFGIALESNVTLPFKWRLEPPDAKVLSLVEEKQHETPPPGCTDCVGTSGTKVFLFESKAAGTTSVRFALKPLTNPAGPPQKEATVSVTVTE